MVGYPFYCKGIDNFIFYNTGNPIGFYSSWAILALTHHYIYYVSSRVNNIYYRDAKYFVLGDDSINGDNDINRSYREIINHLSVPISESKSHISEDMFEFAKR
jgi:hypothetical protein